MITSDRGLALIKSFEACSLTGYADVGGVPTIGWGHTGPNVRVGATITQATADALLRMDLCYAEIALVGLALNQNQFDALVSLVFNIGGANFSGSTLRRFLKQGNHAAAARQFLVWDNVHGKEVAGLKRRREAECKLFMTPVVRGVT